MRKMKNVYIEFLESEGYETTFLKKNARILFNTKNEKINDLIVENFENNESKQYLYNIYSSDIGNCLSDWEDWSFSDVLIKIFVSYVIPIEIRKKILFELSKVEEWRPQLAFWIWRNFSHDA